MIFDIENISGVIKHPTLPEIEIYVRRPDDIEKMEYYTAMGMFTVPVAVLNPKEETVVYEPVRDSNGDEQHYKNGELILTPVVKDLQTIPIKVMVDFFSKVITGGKGFETKAKIPITDPAKIVKLIFNPKLNFRKDGQDSDTPFWMYFGDEVTKEETYDSDPLVS